MSKKALNLIDLFSLYKKNLKYAWYFITLAVVSSLIFIFINNLYMKGKFDIETDITIKSPLKNLDVVNILGVDKLVISEDGSTSLSSVNENIDEYYIVTKEYMKIAFTEALNHNEFSNNELQLNNKNNEILNIIIKNIEDVESMRVKIDNFVNILNSSISKLIQYNLKYENNYLENMLNLSKSDDYGANNELKLIQMRNLMLEGINEENLHLFEIKSEKVIKKDISTKRIITIIFLLSFVLYSLFIVTFR